MSKPSSENSDDSANEPSLYQAFADTSKEYFEEPSKENLSKTYQDFLRFAQEIEEGRSPDLPKQYSKKVKLRWTFAKTHSSDPFGAQQRRMFPMKSNDICPDVYEALAFHCSLHAEALAEGCSLKIGRLSERFCLTGLLPIKTGSQGIFAGDLIRQVQASDHPTDETNVRRVAQTWGDFLKSQESIYLSTSGERAALDNESLIKFKSVQEAITRIRSVSQLVTAYWYRQHLGPDDARVIFHHTDPTVAEDAWTAARFVLEAFHPGSQKTRAPFDPYVGSLKAVKREPGVRFTIAGNGRAGKRQDEHQLLTYSPRLPRSAPTTHTAQAATTSASDQRTLYEAYKSSRESLQESRQVWTDETKAWGALGGDHRIETQTATDPSEHDLTPAAGIMFEAPREGKNNIRCTYDAQDSLDTEEEDQEEAQKEAKSLYKQAHKSCTEALPGNSKEKLGKAYDDYKSLAVAFGPRYANRLRYGEVFDRLFAAESLCGERGLTALLHMFPSYLDDVGPDAHDAFSFGAFLWGVGYLTGTTLKISRQSQRFFLTGLLPIKMGKSEEVFTRELLKRRPSPFPEEKTIEHIAETWNEFLTAEEEIFLSSLHVPEELKTSYLLLPVELKTSCLRVPVELKTRSYSKYERVYQAVTQVKTVEELKDLSWSRQQPKNNDARAIFFHRDTMIAEDGWTAARTLLESIFPGSQKQKRSGFVTDQDESPDSTPPVPSPSSGSQAHPSMPSFKWDLNAAYDRASKALQRSRGVWRSVVGERNHEWEQVKPETVKDPIYLFDRFRNPSEDCQPRKIIAKYDMTPRGFEVDLARAENAEGELCIRPVSSSVPPLPDL